MRQTVRPFISLLNNLCIYFANSTKKTKFNKRTNKHARTPSTNFVATTSDSNNLLNGLDRNLCVRFDSKKVASKLLSFVIEQLIDQRFGCCYRRCLWKFEFPRPVLYVVVFCVIYKFTVTCLSCWLLLLQYVISPPPQQQQQKQFTIDKILFDGQHFVIHN